MNRQEKQQVIDELKEKFSNATNFYLADTSGLTVLEINALRRLCHQSGVEMKVAKNTLIYKALESTNKQDGLDVALKGQSSLFFSVDANAPAKLIKKFRKDGKRPQLKAAYIDSDVYIGDNQIDALINLKSKDELVGDIIALLQSPAKNVIGALLSGEKKLAGIVKTLSEKEEK